MSRTSITRSHQKLQKLQKLGAPARRRTGERNAAPSVGSVAFATGPTVINDVFNGATVVQSVNGAACSSVIGSSRRRVFPRGPDGQALIREPMTVSIDLSEIAFT